MIKQLIKESPLEQFLHANGRIIFRNNKDRFITKYGEILDSENKPQHEEKIPEDQVEAAIC